MWEKSREERGGGDGACRSRLAEKFFILYGQIGPNRTHGFGKTSRIEVEVVVNVRLPVGSFTLVQGVGHAEC